jgi:hypothetical protein
LIPQDKISFIKGTFNGKYNGYLNQSQVVTSLHKTYFVDILPNSFVTSAEFTDDYEDIANNPNSIRLPLLNEVNIFFDLSKNIHAINSKQNLSNVVINDYKIEDVGKEGIKTFGKISGTFYGTIKPPDFKVELKELEKIVPPITSANDIVEALLTKTDVISEPLAPVSRGWRLGGFLSKLFLLLGLLFLLSLLLRQCNNYNAPAPLPKSTLDSFSQDRKDTMQFKNLNAIITVNDWDKPDNDRITVKVNNGVVVNDMLIIEAPQSFQIKNLHQGINSLEIIPTAFGLGHCTATIEIGDSKNTFRFECDIKKGETVKKNLFVN